MRTTKLSKLFSFLAGVKQSVERIIRYNSIQEFNVDRKAECGYWTIPAVVWCDLGITHYNVAHVTKKSIFKKETKKHAPVPLTPVQVASPRSTKAVQIEPERLWRKRFVKQVSLSLE